MPLIIGLTGGFGSGKTFVASSFKKLGAKVIDADALAHSALKKGSGSCKRVIAAFGRAVLDAKGFISRNALAGIVFDNKKSLAKLNRIIHPEVIKKIRKRVRSAANNEVLIIDAPLLCEAGLSSLVDILIVVSASGKNQIERCMKRFAIKEEDVRKRIACQIPLKEKIRMADYVIHNDGARKETEKQVKKIWQELKSFGKSSGLYPERGRRIKREARVWR
jgi:dephospho-CoA kinase